MYVVLGCCPWSIRVQSHDLRHTKHDDPAFSDEPYIWIIYNTHFPLYIHFSVALFTNESQARSNWDENMFETLAL